MRARHLTSLFDLTGEEIEALLSLCGTLKAETAGGVRRPLLPAYTLGMVFEKPSMRTRVAFETAMAQLGGHAIFLAGPDIGLGQRESVADFARVISQYVDALVVRTFQQHLVDELAQYAACPVINGLSDDCHPCQALADAFSVREALGDVTGRRLAFIGDGNNVARSLAVACAHLGMEFVLACPHGCELNGDWLARVRKRFGPDCCRQVNDPIEAARGAHVLYTDVWTSMGREAERQQRRKIFDGFQVNAELLALAHPDAKVMHCLPAHRGEEITSDVLDGPHSIVVRQAANRLPLQKALLVWLIRGMPD